MNDHIVYRRCRAEDIPSLKLLWSLCFAEDTHEEIDSFFDEVFPLSVAFAGFIDDDAVTMLYLLPARACNSERCVSVWYLYAGGTHPSHRARGYYRDLMNAARDWAFASDAAAIYLRPADTGLFRYYAALGYVEPIFTYTDSQSAMIENAQRTTIAQYLQQRQTNWPSSSLSWEPISPIIDHFIGEDTREKWIEKPTVTVENDNKQVAALWIPTTDDTVVIDQLKSAVSYSLIFGE